MRLSQLINIDPGSPDPEIAGLAQDSRDVRRGFLFAALPGSRGDGRVYIEEALRNGAVALVVPAGTSVPEGVGVVHADNPRRHLSRIAAKFYHRQPGTVVAVTGTNGKTSTAHFTQQLWQAQGLLSASLGTLGVNGPGVARAGSMTTPGPVALHAELAGLAAAGVTHLAMEASSHGLQQYRLDDVDISAAGFTNLTRDHLDYHATMDDYFRAKARLFDDILQSGGVAVLNADVPEYEPLNAICARRGIHVMDYGMKGASLRLAGRTVTPHGQEIEIEVLGHTHKLALPLVGAFQAMNALCALGLAMGGEYDRDMVGSLAGLRGAPGRLQRVPGAGEEIAVYVDYAHTPDALHQILAALRPHAKGRLICLFGCGGDRDAGKRPIMGRVAAAESDLVVITDDNPRSEKPEEIRAAIRGGAGPQAKDIPGRREAIYWAVSSMKPGDVLVLAGKGHEQGQVFADHVEPFDDVEEAKSALEAKKGAA